MGSKMLIDASHPEETRVVVLKGNRIEEFDFESAARRQLKGNIYLAKVTRVEPSLQAAFVEYGGNRHGFLAFSEIHPDYYQIPLADRMALLAAEEEEHAREAADEDDEGEGNGRRRRGRDRGRDRGRRRGEENTEGGVEEISEPEYAEDTEAAGDDSFAEDHGPETNEEESPDSRVLDMSASKAIEGEAVEYHNEADDDGDDTPPRAEPMSANHEDPSVSEPVENGGETTEAEETIEARLAGPYPDAPGDAEVEAAAPAPSMQHGMPGELGNGVEEVGEDPDAVRVEEIGAEDALEEVPQRRRKVQRKQYKIQEVIKRRQVILVQVVKEERGNKGAALTTYLSLAGRYCVLMPNTARGGGISRKITDSGDRRRLKEMVKEIEVPQGMGLIVRTAGAQRTKTEIKRDYDYLLRLWESVRDLTLKSQAPALVYEEGSLVKRAIRDLYTKDVDEVIVEGEEAYREVKDFMKMLMPSHAKNVKPYKDSRPLFSRYQAESQLDGLYSPTVTLPSGGYMVINQTEALVSIDINSGKATREHNIEDTAYKTNLEASDEIARQLRLRDLAGLVVIDFIDMEEKRNNRNVERRLKDALKNDRARIQVGHISHFGLLEMSRQRLRPGLLEGSSRTCPHCEGRGVVRSISSCGLSVLRAVEEHLIARKPENITVKCTREIAFYILNEKRDNLLAIETTYGISVFITPSEDLKGSQALIERAPERNIPPRRVMTAPVRIDSAFDEEDGDAETEEIAAEDENGAGEAGDASGEERQSGNDNGEREGGDREGGRRRRRRRGRRGGRGRDEQQAQNGEGDDVPGRGEQPDFGSEDDRDAEESQTEAGDESAVAEAGGEERSEEVERPRRGRDRWGRDRGERPRREDRGRRDERPEAATGAGEAPVAKNPAADGPVVSAPGPALATAPAPVTAADPMVEAPAPVEPPRRWQPPSPTVTAAASERKSGWWNKR
ncbi:MAG: Rne/Rng family ribonuclease [Aestuariivirga sp.]|uniref:Rne/Rng family ribonuclease n=1 Tax=Aestuariivirga sp. TaxID=2650926 RepID=UPI0034576E98|nr:Rne/Rng family ribonuclease [Aestuariivirga sp.]